MTRNAPHTVQPYPRTRLLMVDGGRLGLRRHTVHGLVEYDITHARETLRQHRRRTGEALSFSAFFLACLGRAIDEDKQMHAYRNWRNRLVFFDEVDVNMLFEVEDDGRRTIRPHILRSVNRRSVAEIDREIRTFQAQPGGSAESRFIDGFVRLPGFVRRLFLRALFKHPPLLKEYYGTVLVSSVGMFGMGSGWGIPVPNHTLQLTLGGVGEKPGVVEHRVAVRQYMSVTVSFDHDVVDGAPAARFMHRLKRAIERGYDPDD